MVAYHNPAVHDDCVDAAPVRRIDQVVDRVEQGSPLGPARVEQDEVSPLAGFDRAYLVVHLQRARSGDRRQLDCGFRGDHGNVLAPVLVQDCGEVHRAHRLYQVGVVGGVGSEAYADSGVEQFRQQRAPRHARSAFRRRRRTHRHRCARPRYDAHVVARDAERVRQQHPLVQYADGVQVLGWRPPRPVEPAAARLRRVAVVRSRPDAEVARDLSRARQQLGRREVRRKRHRPRADHPVQRAVEAADCVARRSQSVGGAVCRHVQRIVQVRNLDAGNDAASRLRVCGQTGLDVLRAARIDERRGAVLQQFGNCQQRSQPLFIRSHHPLQLEHVGQIRSAQIVREDAARGVRVANVHMPADEARRNHEVARVNDLIRRDVRQLVRLADGGNRAVRDHDGRVRDDAAFGVEG